MEHQLLLHVGPNGPLRLEVGIAPRLFGGGTLSSRSCSRFPANVTPLETDTRFFGDIPGKAGLGPRLPNQPFPPKLQPVIQQQAPSEAGRKRKTFGCHAASLIHCQKIDLGTSQDLYGPGCIGGNKVALEHFMLGSPSWRFLGLGSSALGRPERILGKVIRKDGGSGDQVISHEKVRAPEGPENPL